MTGDCSEEGGASIDCSIGVVVVVVVVVHDVVEQEDDCAQFEDDKDEPEIKQSLLFSPAVILGAVLEAWLVLSLPPLRSSIRVGEAAVVVVVVAVVVIIIIVVVDVDAVIIVVVIVVVVVAANFVVSFVVVNADKSASSSERFSTSTSTSTSTPSLTLSSTSSSLAFRVFDEDVDVVLLLLLVSLSFLPQDPFATTSSWNTSISPIDESGFCCLGDLDGERLWLLIDDGAACWECLSSCKHGDDERFTRLREGSRLSSAGRFDAISRCPGCVIVVVVSVFGRM